MKYLHLLEVTEREVEDYEALVENEEDFIGRLAQRAYHIERFMGKYFHFLNLDVEKYYNESNDPKQIRKYSLIQKGELSKLPGCKNCFEK